MRYISNRLNVMYAGKIVETGPSQEMYSTPLHPYSQALLSAALPLHPSFRRSRIVLSGEVPSPLAPPSGCRFHPRCPLCMEICSEHEPLLQKAAPGRLVAWPRGEQAGVVHSRGKEVHDGYAQTENRPGVRPPRVDIAALAQARPEGQLTIAFDVSIVSMRIGVPSRRRRSRRQTSIPGPWKQPVEQDQIVAVDPGKVITFLARACDVDQEALFLQPVRQDLSRLPVVLHEQDPHRRWLDGPAQRSPRRRGVDDRAGPDEPTAS